MSSADLDLVRTIGGGSNGLAIVSVARSDGSVHASLVNAGVLAHPSGSGDVVGFVARGDARKLALMRQAGHVSLTFRDGWQWVTVDGVPDFVGRDPQLLRDVFTAAGGTHDDWDEYDRVMAAEQREAVLVIPRRIVTN
jgi:hypothetical protein